MIYPSADKIDKAIDSKYALVVLAAKRAKQLKEGARPLIATDSTNPLTIALEEIAGGAIKYQFDENSLAGREALEDKKAVVGSRTLDVENDPLALPDDLVAKAATALGADLDLDDSEDDSEVEEEVEEEEDEDEALSLDGDAESAEA